MKKYQREIKRDMEKKLATVKPTYTEKEKEEAIHRMHAVDRKRKFMLDQLDLKLGELYSIEVHQETLTRQKHRILAKAADLLKQLIP